jgi:integrase
VSIVSDAVGVRMMRFGEYPDARSVVMHLRILTRMLSELQALEWSNIDLAAGVIHVRGSWDEAVGRIDPKSAAGDRKVPIAAVLRDRLVFGKTADDPFYPH